MKGSLGAPALVISECQNGTVSPEHTAFPGLAEQAVSRGILERIAALAATFRKAGHPVLHGTFVPRSDWGGFGTPCKLLSVVRRQDRFKEGCEAAEIHPVVAPQADDIVVSRRRGLSLFHDTELDAILRSLGIRTVVLVGVSTNVALFVASVDAVNRNYTVVIPEDCTAGASAETHRFMVEHTLPLLVTMARAAEVGTAVGESER